MNLRGTVKLNLLASWGVNVVAMLVALILTPFVLHALGQEQYGSWIFINSIAGYSGLMFLGLGKTICRYVATCFAKKDWERLNRIINFTLFVYLGMGAIALVVAGLLILAAPCLWSWPHVSLLEVRLVIAILGLNVAIGLAGSVFGGVLMGIQRFDIERSVRIVAWITRLAVTLLCLQKEWGLFTLAWITLMVTVVENLGHLVFAKRLVPEMKLNWRFVKRSTFHECVAFSGYSLLDNIAHKLVYATDTVVIGIFLGPEAIVPYYIALRLCEDIRLAIEQVETVVMPRASDLDARSEPAKIRKLLVQCAGFAFLLTCGFFIGAGFFGGKLIETWIGDGFANSHLLLVILLASQLIAIPAGVLRSVLFGMGHARLPAILHTIEAVANLGLTLILIKPFGLLGVALGTVIPLVVVELGLLVPYGLQLIKVRALPFLRQTVTPQLLPLMALFVYSAGIAHLDLPSTTWPEMIGVTAGGGVILGFFWLWQQGLLRPVAARVFGTSRNRSNEIV